MGYCDVGDSSWKARLQLGVVQYNSLSQPTALEAKRQIPGLDGGNFTAGWAEGHRPLAVDGGDLGDPQWQWNLSPLIADGGRWS